MSLLPQALSKQSSSLAPTLQILKPFHTANSSTTLSKLFIPINPLPKPSPPPPPPNTQFQELYLGQGNDEPSLLHTHTSTVSKLLRQFPHDPPTLQSALHQTSIQPYPLLIHTLLLNSPQLPPTPFLALYLWASTHPSFVPTPSLLSSAVEILARSRLFDAAWSLLIPHLLSPLPTAPFASLIRRYARSGSPLSAIRSFEFTLTLPPPLRFTTNPNDSDSDLLHVLLDALCKEGHVNAAHAYLRRRKAAAEPDRGLSVRAYNILLNGYFRSRKLNKAERLFEEMKRDSVRPSVVTFGTLVEGYCRMKRVDRAIQLLSEMGPAGAGPNMIVCNPIIDALGEARRFEEALAMVERLPARGLAPNVSTFNSLVKGFCKAGDLLGASRVLTMMIERGCLPSSTTYNYFFGFFAKFGKVDEGMNLYTKMVQCGYEPDRLTYHFLVKMLCEHKRLDLSVRVIKEMNERGYDSDLATSTMLVHLLCRLRRLDEACQEFESMIKRGVVPQYITFRMLTTHLKKQGMLGMVRKLSELMDSVLHSTNLPQTYMDIEQRHSYEERSDILRKAQKMSDILKTCKHPRELGKQRVPWRNAVASANQLIVDIQKKFFETSSS